MRLNSTTPRTSAAAVNTRLYTMPKVVTVPVPSVAMRKISMGEVMGLSWTRTFRRGLDSNMDSG